MRWIICFLMMLAMAVPAVAGDSFTVMEGFATGRNLTAVAGAGPSSIERYYFTPSTPTTIAPLAAVSTDSFWCGLRTYYDSVNYPIGQDRVAAIRIGSNSPFVVLPYFSGDSVFDSVSVDTTSHLVMQPSASALNLGPQWADEYVCVWECVGANIDSLLLDWTSTVTCDIQVFYPIVE